MKTRNGFISNSSSSSFVVYLPDNLSFNEEDIQEVLEQLLSDGSIYESEDYDVFERLTSVLRPYVVASFDVPSESGQITIADKKRIKEIEEGRT